MQQRNAPPDRSTTASGARRRSVRGVAVALAAMVCFSACGQSDDAALEVDATVDGIDLDDATAANPLRLSTEESELALSIVNTSDEPQAVRYLRLEGEMLGLTFLTYTTRVAVELQPGETRTITVPLDFFDIDRQAHGYLRAKLALYAPGADRQLLATHDFAVDVRGSVTSTMALFAFLLFAATAASIYLNVVGLARGTLPSNRFRRALRFAVSGLGVGMLFTVAFSVLRIFPLPSVAWWPLLIIPTVIGFGVGYTVLDTGDDIDEEELDDLRELDETLAAVAAATESDDSTT
jgi:hypothetical protein